MKLVNSGSGRQTAVDVTEEANENAETTSVGYSDARSQDAVNDHFTDDIGFFLRRAAHVESPFRWP